MSTMSPELPQLDRSDPVRGLQAVLCGVIARARVLSSTRRGPAVKTMALPSARFFDVGVWMGRGVMAPTVHSAEEGPETPEGVEVLPGRGLEITRG